MRSQTFSLGEPFVEGSSPKVIARMGSAPLAITCGDPAGVGPELIEAVLRAEGRSEFGELAVIGPDGWLRGLPENCQKVSVGDVAFRAEPGVPSAASARVASAAMECAAAGCLSGRFSGVVTGPVSKAELVRGAGFTFPGQTEFFAARWGGEPVMGFVGERLRVVLATWHMPLGEVGERLSREPVLLARAVAAAAALAPEKMQARIAVCGLNPHAGEGGLLGAEERDFLNPILRELSARYSGLVPECLPGDTVFARALRGEFDVAVALYHDQGLAPLKAVDFDSAVNVTLGLPFVRTSPDHGTAFDLAGRGRASAQSFANAVRLARHLLLERNAS